MEKTIKLVASEVQGNILHITRIDTDSENQFYLVSSDGQRILYAFPSGYKEHEVDLTSVGDCFAIYEDTVFIFERRTFSVQSPSGSSDIVSILQLMREDFKKKIADLSQKDMDLFEKSDALASLLLGVTDSLGSLSDTVYSKYATIDQLTALLPYDGTTAVPVGGMVISKLSVAPAAGRYSGSLSIIYKERQEDAYMSQVDVPSLVHAGWNDDSETYRYTGYRYSDYYSKKWGNWTVKTETYTFLGAGGTSFTSFLSPLPAVRSHGEVHNKRHVATWNVKDNSYSNIYKENWAGSLSLLTERADVEYIFTGYRVE